MFDPYPSFEDIDRVYELLKCEAAEGRVTSMRLLAMLHFCDKAALRSGEVRSLKLNDVRINSTHFMELSVTGSQRSETRDLIIDCFEGQSNPIPLCASLRDWIVERKKMLDAHGIESNILFCSARGNKLDSKNFSREIRLAGERAGLTMDLGVQDIRRLRCIHIYIEQGEEAAMKFCGYRNPGSIRRIAYYR